MTLFEKTSDHNGNISKPWIQVMVPKWQNYQKTAQIWATIWLFNIAMENSP
jgi:hypothetical protein